MGQQLFEVSAPLLAHQQVHSSINYRVPQLGLCEITTHAWLFVNGMVSADGRQLHKDRGMHSKSLHICPGLECLHDPFIHPINNAFDLVVEDIGAMQAQGIGVKASGLHGFKYPMVRDLVDAGTVWSNFQAVPKVYHAPI